ncbi:hypothetical protein GQ53DRAFT_750179 [Thozetella sp. PMI_491]|nr:hypothetical protein GQ53DRAFT_750179 [Thozetella sp. PMI_491]
MRDPVAYRRRTKHRSIGCSPTMAGLVLENGVFFSLFGGVQLGVDPNPRGLVHER